MEQGARSKWTDERIDDLAARIDAGFDRVDRRFEQVDRRFEQVDRRFEQVHQDIGDLRQLMIRLNLGLFLAIIAALAAIVARGG